jgi:hypothetical protein
MYNLFNNHIIPVSLPALSYHIFLHSKIRNTWNIGYLLHAFQKFRRSRDYNFTVFLLTSLAFQKALNVISLVSINFTELIVHALFVCLLFVAA